MDKPYYVYLLRCTDGSLYAGITTDVKRRFAEHLSGSVKGAKYTKTHPPKEIAAVWQAENRSVASKIEWKLKHLTKAQKEILCKEANRLAEYVPIEGVEQVNSITL